MIISIPNNIPISVHKSIPYNANNSLQKMMKNTLKVIVDAKKEAKRDVNHKVLL